MTNHWVPRGIPSLGHVAPPYSLKLDATCQALDGPLCHITSLSYYHTLPCVTTQTCYMSSYGRATCHPCNGDKCHFLVGPLVHATSLVRTSNQPAMSFVWTLPHRQQNFFHVICTVIRPVQSTSMWHCTDCIVNIVFACLEKQIDHHNLRI
jgi:hypothetical protein